ncbi:hypothetical protein [Calidifontibacter terrae]
MTEAPRRPAGPHELAAHQMVLERAAHAVSGVAESTATMAVSAPCDADIAQAIDQLSAVLAGVGDAVAKGLADLATIIDDNRSGREG